MYYRLKNLVPYPCSQIIFWYQNLVIYYIIWSFLTDLYFLQKNKKGVERILWGVVPTTIEIVCLIY